MEGSFNPWKEHLPPDERYGPKKPFGKRPFPTNGETGERKFSEKWCEQQMERYQNNPTLVSKLDALRQLLEGRDENEPLRPDEQDKATILEKEIDALMRYG